MNPDRIILENPRRVCVIEDLEDCEEYPGSLECCGCPYNRKSREARP